jgi:hypothetical protein
MVRAVPVVALRLTVRTDFVALGSRPCSAADTGGFAPHLLVACSVCHRGSPSLLLMHTIQGRA